MKLTTISVLVLMLVVAFYRVQNAGVITVRFLLWHFGLSLALIIPFSAVCGVLGGLVLGALGRPNKPPPPVTTP